MENVERGLSNLLGGADAAAAAGHSKASASEQQPSGMEPNVYEAAHSHDDAVQRFLLH